MKTRLSALMDGELEAHETALVLRAASRDAALRADWQDFHLLGDAMRGEPVLDFDIADKVMRALDDEPTVLAPTARRRSEALSPLLALAASVAGVALVAWVGLGDSMRGRMDDASWSHAPVAKLAKVAADTATPAPSVEMSERMQEYLVAHQAHAPTPAVTNGTRYVRTVAVVREGR